MEKAQDDASQKGKELQVIVEAYDKARSLADKIRDVEVDITHQLGEYDKVRRGKRRDKRCCLYSIQTILYF